jgi:hypothetical protein
MSDLAVIVGRWYGVWSFIWYADIVVENYDEPYTSFNALSRRGAVRKATRYIRKRNRVKKDLYTYVYDQSLNRLEKVDV